MRGSSGCKLGRASVCVISAKAQNRDGGHRSSAKAGRLSAGNCESSGSQAGSCAKTQAGMTSNNLLRKIIKAVCRSAAQMQLNSGVTTIRTVGGVVVLKKGCQCGWLPESFPETGMRAVFVISQAPDSAYVRIE